MFWGILTILKLFEMQNCADTSDVLYNMEDFPQCDRAHLLTQDRALSYRSNARDQAGS